MCDLWQDEEGFIQSEEETAEEMSSYESEDNQDQVSYKTSTLKINAKINGRHVVYFSVNFMGRSLITYLLLVVF